VASDSMVLNIICKILFLMEFLFGFYPL